MGGTRDIQTAFNGGELSPYMLGRGDVAAYEAGMRSLLNFVVLKPGGVERRMGSLFVDECFDESVSPALIRFHSGLNASYCLEFAPGIFRVFRNGGLLVLSTFTLDCAQDVNATSDELYVANHGYFHGAGPFRVAVDGTGTLPTGLSAAVDYYIVLPQTVPIDSVDTTADTYTAIGHGMTEGMGPFRFKTTQGLPAGMSGTADYYVRNPTASTFQLSETVAGPLVNMTTAGSGSFSLVPLSTTIRRGFRLRDNGGTLVNLTSTGTGTFRIIPQAIIPARFTHPYAASQLATIDYAQSGDVLYLAHEGTPPQKITRHSLEQFECTEVELYDGPYLLLNETLPNVAYPTLTLAKAATTGINVTITASPTAIFTGADVGRLIRIAGPGAEETRWGFGRITSVGGITFQQSDIAGPAWAGGSVDTVADTVTIAAHGFIDGEGPCRVTSNAAGLSIGTDYWLEVIDPNTIAFHLSQALALAGSPATRVALIAAGNEVVSSWINKAAHGLPARTYPVTLKTTGTLPPGLGAGVVYYMLAPDANHIQFATAPASGYLAIEDDVMTGVATVNGNSVPSLTCLVDVLEAFPSVSATTNWRLGAFGANPGLGYPRAVGFMDQRLVYGGTEAEPQTHFFSTAGDFENFAPDVEDSAGDHTIVDSSGITFTTAAEDASVIHWLVTLRTLISGCLDGIHQIQGLTLEQGITPSNVTGKRQARLGIADIKPVVVNAVALFVSGSRQAIRGARFDVEQDHIIPSDLTALSQHLGELSKFKQLAYSGSPFDLAYALREDGTICTLTFDPTQDVSAWCRWILGGNGAIEAITTTNDEGEFDQLWMVVRRTIGGVTRRYIEVLAPRFELADDIDEAHYLDCGIDVTLSPPATTVTGLNHLEGQTVQVMADGSELPSEVVTGGQITLASAKSRVHVGYEFNSEGESMPPEVPSSQLGLYINPLTKRIVRLHLRILRSLGLEIGRPGEDRVEVQYRSLRSDPMDNPMGLRSGVVEVPLGPGYDKDGGYVFGTRTPLPLTVLSALVRLEWSDR